MERIGDQRTLEGIGLLHSELDWGHRTGPWHIAERLDAILPAKSLHLPLAVSEWYLLAANWNPGGVNSWVHPRDLVAYDGRMDVLFDKHGVDKWGIRCADFQQEDPAVISDNEIAVPTFSQFVAGMIVNDVLFFDDVAGELLELKRGAVRAQSMRVVIPFCGEFFADGPLESATTVMYAYPRKGAVFGKSRTPEGRALLRQLRNC